MCGGTELVVVDRVHGASREGVDQRAMRWCYTNELCDGTYQRAALRGSNELWCDFPIPPREDDIASSSVPTVTEDFST